jgi:hypothetical protein
MGELECPDVLDAERDDEGARGDEQTGPHPQEPQVGGPR